MSNLIDDTLTECRWPELYRMAEFHEKQATILRARAVTLQKREDMQSRVKLEMEFLRNTHKTVSRYLKQGHCITRAIELTAKHTDVAEVTIAKHWQNFLDSKKKKDIKHRNQMILEMHGLGLSNVAIADRLNLHPVSVSRILTKERDKRIYNPNPEKLKLFLERPELKNQRKNKAA